MRLLVLTCCVLLFGCSQNKKPGQIQTDLSVLAHGGIEAYQALQAVHVAKTIRLFDSLGALEKETIQFQVLRHAPGAGSMVGWKDVEGLYRVTDHGGELLLTLNDSLIPGPESEEKVRSTIDGAKFVLLQPFKLATDDIRLLEVGERQLDGFGDVKMFRLQFPEDSKDRWYFYFDEQQRLVANEVVHNGRRSLIENLEFQLHQDLLLHKHRKSYFVDSLHTTKLLRAEYFYDYFQ